MSQLIWSTAQARQLRTEHRIIGDFIGALVVHPQQNDYHGLPLLVTQQELQCVQSPVADQTVEDVTLASIITDIVNRYIEAKVQAQNNKAAYVNDYQVIQLPRQISIGTVKNILRTYDGQFTMHSLSKHVVQWWFASQGFDIPRDQTFGSFTSTITYNTKVCLQVDVATDEESVIFQDIYKLQDGNFYLGSGLRTGSRWSLYPGDIMLTHACSVVHVVPFSDCPKPLLRRLLCWTRLAINVNKNVVLASLDEDGTPQYLTVSAITQI